jgi:hypothetical protein
MLDTAILSASKIHGFRFKRKAEKDSTKGKDLSEKMRLALGRKLGFKKLEIIRDEE